MKDYKANPILLKHKGLPIGRVTNVRRNKGRVVFCIEFYQERHHEDLLRLMDEVRI